MRPYLSQNQATNNAVSASTLPDAPIPELQVSGAIPEVPSGLPIDQPSTEPEQQSNEVFTQMTDISASQCTSVQFDDLCDSEWNSGDARPESIRKLMQANKFLRGLVQLSDEELQLYNHELSDRITTNNRLRDGLKILFETCLKNRTQVKLYDRHIRSCFNKIFQLQFVEIPELWKDTIHDLTSEYVKGIMTECITSDELDYSAAIDNTVNRFQVLLNGKPDEQDTPLGLFPLQMLNVIMIVILPEEREMDEKYFDQLHESVAFYTLIKSFIDSCRQRRDFVEDERSKMVSLLKKLEALVDDSTFYIHEKCPLLQIELAQLLIQIQLFIEVLEKS